jgi:predicted HTH transcriptional regulator
MLNNFKNGENDIGHIYSVGSGFNRVIELNQKMLILKRLLPVCSQQTVRPLPPIEPLPPLCVPSLLPGVEVSCPKTINIKQYLNTNNFIYSVGSGFNRVIELNQKMLILKRFCDEK